MLPPRRSGIPPIAITPYNVEIIPKKEGVILQAAAENKRIETKEDFNSEPKNHGLSFKKNSRSLY
jgi:hypothetical protein